VRKIVLAQIYPTFAALIVFTVLTGLVYPGVVTALAQLVFPHEANGSLIVDKGHTAGSALIGQWFSDSKYFWPRPSATSSYPYNAASSSGSNLGPTNPVLEEAVATRIRALRDADPGSEPAVPADLVTSSASGLDPHISPEAAAYQVARVAHARGLPVEEVQRLVQQYTEDRTWGVLGERRVNVLRLNLALDSIVMRDGSR